MFGRAFGKFCLPCGGETEADDVSEMDPDSVYFVPKDFHLVKARLRAQRHKELVSRMEANFQKMEPPPASSDVTAAEQESQLQAAAPEDSQERRSTEEEPHQKGEILQERKQNGPSVQGSQMEEVQTPKESVQQERITRQVAAAPESGSEGEVPPTDRRPRVCRHCWQRRAAVRPRRILFYPPSIY